MVEKIRLDKRTKEQIDEEDKDPHIKWKKVTPSKTLAEGFEKRPELLQLIILAGSMLVGIGLIIIALNDITNNLPLAAVGLLVWGVAWAYELPTYLSLRRVK
jgi:hypothetical protein